MNEPPGARQRVGLTALTMAEYFRDEEGRDVLLSSTTSSASPRPAPRFRAARPNAVGGRLPAEPRHGDGRSPGTNHVDQEGFDYFAPGGLRSGGHYTDPAPATTFGHLDSTIRLERAIAELGIYPAVDPLTSTSRVLDPNVVGRSTTTRPARSSGSCSVTATCRTSSRSWASMSCPKRTSRPWPGPGGSRSSTASRSTWRKSSPAAPAPTSRSVTPSPRSRRSSRARSTTCRAGLLPGRYLDDVRANAAKLAK